MVASDRISAYDFVLDTTIPDKGEILTRMSLWWFDQLAGLVAQPRGLDRRPRSRRAAAPWCASALEMFPVECVARGYLTGSGLLDYARTGEVCGIPLPAGLQDGSRLPEPIFTPATKADLGDHDENVDYEAVVEADRRRRRRRAADADHGGLRQGRTPSPGSAASSWPTPSSSSAGDRTAPRSSPTRSSPPTAPASGPPTSGSPAAPSRRTTSRSCGTGSSGESGWDRTSGEAPPPLPDAVVERTRARYVEAYELLTGETF